MAQIDRQSEDAKDVKELLFLSRLLASELSRKPLIDKKRLKVGRRSTPSPLKTAPISSEYRTPENKEFSVKYVRAVLLTVAVLFLAFTGTRAFLNKPADDYAIDWEDDALEAAMQEVTGISDRAIMYSDVCSIKKQSLWHCQISNISALSNLENLTELYLSTNQIRDISALSSLQKLTVLHLSNNQINDISATSNLTNLTELKLEYNQIDDISPLNGLVNLTILDLRSNPITDYSPIVRLNIRKLYMW